MEHFLDDLKILFADPNTLYPFQVRKQEEMVASLLVLACCAAFLLLVVLLLLFFKRRYDKKHLQESPDEPQSPAPVSSAPLPEGSLSTAEKLQTLRRSRGLSQEQLANQLNISRQAISKWELGDSFPDAENLLALSRLYGVSIDYILNPDWTQPPAAAAAPQPFWKRAADWLGRNGHYIGYGVSIFFAFEFFAGILAGLTYEMFSWSLYHDNVLGDPDFWESIASSLADWGLCLVMVVIGLVFAKYCRDWQKAQPAKGKP